MGSRKAQDMVMKYRIKVVELPDGNKEYYPQYRFLFFWFKYEQNYKPVVFASLTECKRFVDYQIKLKNKENVRYIEYR